MHCKVNFFKTNTRYIESAAALLRSSETEEVGATFALVFISIRCLKTPLLSGTAAPETVKSPKPPTPRFHERRSKPTKEQLTAEGVEGEKTALSDIITRKKQKQTEKHKLLGHHLAL